jgi:hypothetical protein
MAPWRATAIRRSYHTQQILGALHTLPHYHSAELRLTEKARINKQTIN